MSVFSTRAAATPASQERRSFVLPSLAGSYDDGGFGSVDASVTATAVQSIAVRSAMDLLASLVSELPVHVYTGTGDTRQKKPTPGYLEDPAGDGHGYADWAYQLVFSWLARGNAYGDILDQRNGIITQLLWHYPDDVSGDDANGAVLWRVNGREVPSERFYHSRVNSVPGRVLGLSPIQAHAASIGLSITTTRFGNQWFRDGAHPGGLLTNEDEDLTPKATRTAKDRFLASLRGTRDVAVLGKGWKYQAIQVAPEESQFLQTQGYTEAQCARIFGPGIGEILGYESGKSMTYANVVDRRADVLVFSLNKWIRRAERILTSMLPGDDYARIERDALLQSTTLERYKAHELALDNQWKTVNEVRRDEDMAPVAWGDLPNKPKPSTTNQNPDGGNGNPA